MAEFKGRPGSACGSAPPAATRRFCHSEEGVFGARRCAVSRREDHDINYKDVKMLHAFAGERGRIVPRRISGVCRRPSGGSRTPSRKGAQHRAACRSRPNSKGGEEIGMESLLREDIEKLGRAAAR